MKYLNISKNQFKNALMAKGVLNKHRIAVLKALYETSFSIATSRELGVKIGEKTGTVNLRFGKIGHAVANYLNVVPEKRRAGSPMWWSVLADGVPDFNGFNWRLKKNLVDAINELGLFHEPGFYPDDIDIRKREYPEGWLKSVMVNAYERNSAARTRCIEIYGLNCHVCDMNFEDVYGEIGKDFIHVHHKVSVSSYKGRRYEVDPKEDLIPVCPNCHAMIHRRDPPYSIEEISNHKKRIHKKISN